MYLDEGFVVASFRQAMCALATTIRSDLDKCVFLLARRKVTWITAKGRVFGYSVDLENGVFLVPQKKVNGLLNFLHDVRS